MCLAGTGDRWQNYGVDMKQMGLLGNRAVFSTVRVRKKSHFNNVLIFLLVSGACMTPLSRPSVKCPCCGRASDSWKGPRDSGNFESQPLLRSYSPVVFGIQVLGRRLLYPKLQAVAST